MYIQLKVSPFVPHLFFIELLFSSNIITIDLKLLLVSSWYYDFCIMVKGISVVLLS